MDNDLTVHAADDPKLKDSHEEGLATEALNPLALDIDDEEKLIENIDKRIEDSRDFYESEYDLYDRRKELEIYYFGKQIKQKEDNKELKKYESRYQDNVLYEIQATLKPLAMSRIPDLIVLPGNESDDAKLMAQEITQAIDTQIKERENRRVLGIAFNHRPVYLTGVIKARWDNQLDDYVFEVIHPDNIDVDYTCPSNNADRMDWIAQTVPMTVKEVLMRFPEKKTELFDQLEKDGLMKDIENPVWQNLATEIKVREVWFKWPKRKSDTQYEMVWGVLWKYKDVLLKKMKNPNYDYEGETKYFAYDDPSDESTKRELNMAEMSLMLMGQQPDNVQTEQVYYNYFDHPRHPFYFMGYDQWNRQPYDETSWLEQNMHNQQSLDKRGKQIDETLDNRGHHVWSKDSGLKPSDIQGIDMNDPDQDAVVDGNVNDVHKFIEPERPEAQEFQNLSDTRNRMYQSAGADAVQGHLQTDVATSNQIAREANFTRADDLVEDTINAAAEWMAEWAMQFIKLRYTTDHWKRILGDAGDVVFIKLHRNMISDGMVVKIKASGTDKLRAQNNAMDMARMEMIDPFNFFKDMGLSDPEGRTEDLMLFKTDPASYMLKTIKGLQTSEQIAQALMQQPMPGQPPQGPMMPGTAQQVGAVPQPPGAPVSPVGNQQPQQPTPGNTSQAPVAPPQGPPQGSPRGI